MNISDDFAKKNIWNHKSLRKMIKRSLAFAFLLLKIARRWLQKRELKLPDYKKFPFLLSLKETSFLKLSGILLKIYFIAFTKWLCFLFWLSAFPEIWPTMYLKMSTPCISDSCIKIKNNLNLYFHISLSYLKRFHEGL